MTIGSRQKIRATDDEIIIKINENEVNRVDSVKSLGVHIYTGCLKKKATT
jgi:hypothetical protein